MHLNEVFARDCVACPAPPVCNCAPTETCVTTSRDCNSCGSARCMSSDTVGTSTSGGVSKGAVAGAVIGVLLFLGLAIAGLLWYRRRRATKGSASIVEPKESPARAADVLQRVDPNEKPESNPPTPSEHPSAGTTRLYPHNSNQTIDLDPTSLLRRQSQRSQRSQQSNPFSDQYDGADIASLRTASASSRSTNVIPIALVSPPLNESSSPAPARPMRSPELELNNNSSLNLDHANVSSGEGSTRTGWTAGTRASFMTGVSDLLTEAPQIVTLQSNASRQVLGVAKPAIWQPNTPLTASSLGAHRTSRPTRSPLAQGSFGPQDMSATTSEADTTEPNTADPFADGRRNSQESLRTQASRPNSVWTAAGARVGSATRSPLQSAQAQFVELQRRPSVGSTTSASFSVLENFPFVPPSPLSQAPSPRSPQFTPGVQTVTIPPTPNSPHFQVQPPVSSTTSIGSYQDRRFLGMSTVSQVSQASSVGLNEYAFKIESPLSGGPEQREQSQAGSPSHGGTRASLDTLALSRDVLAFPLPGGAERSSQS